MIENNLRVLAPCEAPGPEKMEAITVVGGLVYTIAQHERSHEKATQEQLAAQIELLRSTVADGSHPHAAAAHADPGPQSGESPDERLSRMLTRFLNGLLPENRSRRNPGAPHPGAPRRRPSASA